MLKQKDSGLRQAGIIAPLLIFAISGIIIFLLISATLPFKDKLFSLLYPKPASEAANNTDTSYNLGVLVIKYFPLTADGQNIDIVVTGDVGDPYTAIRQKTIDITQNLTNSLPSATKYLGYKDPNAQPALTYAIVDTKEYTQAVPMLTDGTRRPNYNNIMTTHNICDYVDNKGVREVWLWAYQGPVYPGSTYPYLAISESKMAGPFGDISNSPRTNDMPACQNTYRLYTFNYSRGTPEAVDSWGHQIEAELDAVDRTLFRDKFQGPNYPQTLGVNGRCGSVHNPPNARNEYDRSNPTPQKSDCLDWQPDSLGALSDISCSNWGCQEISDTNNPPLNYMIWNWQNLPGRNNTKTYQGQQLRNWWDVHGDFDKVMGQDKSLFLSTSYQDPNEAYTEQTANLWSCDSSDKAACAVSDDTGRVKVNSYSVKVTTSSGSDFWAFFPQTKNANWNLINTSYFNFWVYSDNPNQNGYQGNLPVIYLKNSAGGYYNYVPSSNLLGTAEKSWKQFRVPLAGDSTWLRSSSGAVSLSDIDYLEIHADTWDYGFTLWLDGMYFSPAPTVPTPSPTPTPTSTPTPTPTPTSTPTPTPTPTPTSAPADTQPPTVPTNLAGNPVSSSQINLSWTASTDNVGVTGYDVYRNNAKVATVITTSYGDTGLQPATTYSYYVRAFDSAGNISLSSNTVSVVTQPAQVGTGSITGTVYSSGKVLSGAVVSTKINKSKKSYMTDSQGVFNIVDIPAGTYTLTIKKSGYLTQTVSVSVTSGEVTTLTINLTKR